MQARFMLSAYHGVEIWHAACIDSGMAKLNTEERDRLPDSQFAFPKQKKEPLSDAAHVRNAIARFDQVEGVSNAERDEAWKHIQAAAKKFNVPLDEKDWRELFQRNGRSVPKS